MLRKEKEDYWNTDHRITRSGIYNYESCSEGYCMMINSDYSSSQSARVRTSTKM